MKKEEILAELEKNKVDVSLTQSGEIRTELLTLALKGAQADSKQAAALEEQKQAYEKVVTTLNQTIEELQQLKTPVEKAGLVLHKKTKKKYRTAGPKCRFKGQDVTAEVLNNNQSLLDDLIESKSPWLIEEGV